MKQIVGQSLPTQFVLLHLLVLTGSEAFFFLGPRPAYPRSVVEISRIQNVPELLNYFNYSAETYQVVTEDSYILTLHRIPQIGGVPVLLVHGMKGSSINWLMNGPWADLPYLLYDNGYDVWLANTRGAGSDLNHVYLEPTNAAYWNFSWHEIGLYDLPAIIDYIILLSIYDQVSYIGHSQGGTAFFVMASLRPDYNRKIGMMHAIAPGVNLRNIRTPYLPYLSNVFRYYQPPFAVELFAGAGNFQQFCLISKHLVNKCLALSGQLFGPNVANINKTMVPVIFNRMTSSVSLRQLAHYYQIHRTGVFAPFDNQFWRNGTTSATPYPLNRVTSKVALYYSQNDYLVSVEGMRQLATQLPNVVENYLVPDPKWNHVDPIMGKNAREILYNYLVASQAYNCC